MLKQKNRVKLWMGLIIAVAAIILAIVVIYIVSRGGSHSLPAVTPRPSAEIIIRDREVEKIVQVEKEVSAETISDGLRDMGVLITEEYYFTEVVSFSSIKKLWNIDLGITESSYLASYDGVVTAGIDLSKAAVEKDDESLCVKVKLPHAEIRNVDIDPESFVLYSEKAGLGNRLSAADFNSSLVELENTARDKALDRGLLGRADENAKTLVRNFIASLVDLSRYSLVFEWAD